MNKIGGSFNKVFGVVLLVSLVMLFIKLYVSYNVYGSNDIASAVILFKLIEKFGTFNAYAMTEGTSYLVNFSPLVLWIFKLNLLIHHKTQLSLPFLYRLMPIISDFFSVILIWKLMKKYQIKNSALICIICALNPINFLIAGYHGSLDPVFILLILFTICLIEDNRIILAGMIYGLSMCIKMSSIILIPVFFYFFKINKQKIAFFISFFSVPVFVFTPYLMYDYHSVIKNVFFYNSFQGGVWGMDYIIGHILANESFNIFVKPIPLILIWWYTAYFKFIFFIIEILLLKFLMTYKKLNLIELSFLVFSLFLIMTPGFGVQYLTWLSFFAVIIFPLLGSIYVFGGGFILCLVYVCWGGGKYPYFANALAFYPKQSQWVVCLDLLLVLWLLIIVMFIKFILDRKVFIKNS